MDIPAHSLPEEVDHCNICMKIIPPDVSDWSVTDLVSNSSVVVELLPNNLGFQQPFTLTLPHCLQLKKGAQHKATIFVSHHNEGMTEKRHVSCMTCNFLVYIIISLKM